MPKDFLKWKTAEKLDAAVREAEKGTAMEDRMVLVGKAVGKTDETLVYECCGEVECACEDDEGVLDGKRAGEGRNGEQEDI